MAISSLLKKIGGASVQSAERHLAAVGAVLASSTQHLAKVTAARADCDVVIEAATADMQKAEDALASGAPSKVLTKAQAKLDELVALRNASDRKVLQASAEVATAEAALATARAECDRANTIARVTDLIPIASTSGIHTRMTKHFEDAMSAYVALESALGEMSNTLRTAQDAATELKAIGYEDAESSPVDGSVLLHDLGHAALSAGRNPAGLLFNQKTDASRLQSLSVAHFVDLLAQIQDLPTIDAAGPDGRDKALAEINCRNRAEFTQLLAEIQAAGKARHAAALDALPTPPAAPKQTHAPWPLVSHPIRL
jgi:hypothetical protein